MPDVGKVLRALYDSYAEINPDEKKIQIRELEEYVSNLEEENKRMKSEVVQLQEQLKRRKDLEFKGNAYFFYEKETEFGPICPECYTEKGFVYLLADAGKGARCTVCGNVYSGVKASVEGNKMRIG